MSKILCVFNGEWFNALLDVFDDRSYDFRAYEDLLEAFEFLDDEDKERKVKVVITQDSIHEEDDGVLFASITKTRGYKVIVLSEEERTIDGFDVFNINSVLADDDILDAKIRELIGVTH